MRVDGRTLINPRPRSGRARRPAGSPCGAGSPPSPRAGGCVRGCRDPRSGCPACPRPRARTSRLQATPATRSRRARRRRARPGHERGQGRRRREAGGTRPRSASAWGRARVRDPKPKRFSVSYHLLRVADDPARVRVQVWLDDGEPVASVLPVWPAADWFEREAWDMLGIRFEGHGNLVRILLPEDWEGFPLRKDYPLGGEPVRFSDED